ncbi:hypothetical protein KR51_00006280 [Rubidibacter lacunae KORDI 51-2]|uniref:Uncharacterized protein n=1 Tax=Rubidibacter lacunae KORDI 51-2 TaxID=582515 RepID=U5DPA7_9CHRO|nr:hypothetical protein KR51_00006280 [Rubidibacter lacunae KORDI 51-2]
MKREKIGFEDERNANSTDTNKFPDFIQIQHFCQALWMVGILGLSGFFLTPTAESRLVLPRARNF